MMDALTPIRHKTLGELLGELAPAALAGTPVPDISLDSRRVAPGGMFLAVPGARVHGLKFAAQAAQAGAALVAWEPADGCAAPRLPETCKAFPVTGLRRLLGGLADRFFDAPSRQMAVTGVTGTNGKTTCTHLVAEALQRLGRPAGLIGTLGSGPVGALEPATLTTPDVVEVHRRLASLAAREVAAVSMEVSSHALDQGRVDGVRYAVAGFTNLTRDHLDYHPSFEAYGAAKARLFFEHAPAAAVINVDDAFGRAMFQRLAADTWRVAVGRQADAFCDAQEQVILGEVEALGDGLALRLSGKFGSLVMRARLIGDFNGENIALSFGMLLAQGVDPHGAAGALGQCAAPPGRMEAFQDAGRGVLAVVDYAHTPDALAKALTALRQHCTGRLWCVFGCGGDRDRGKRPQMGRVAEQLADEFIVTDDNPRTEDGVAIVADILSGLAQPARARVQRDRAAAIREALHGARPGDVVLVAGKGHEAVQIIGTEQRPFSDRTLVADLTGARP